MACENCKNQKEIERVDVPYVIRKCPSCGREMRISEPGEHGIGIKVQKGDQFIFPEGWLKIHVNPLKGRGQLTKAGLKWFADIIFLGELPKQKDQIEEVLTRNDQYCVDLLKKSELLKGLDVENAEHAKKIFEILKNNQESAEWFAYMFGLFNQLTQEAIQESDAKKSAWAMACAERFRSLLVFKQDLEEVVWMGHSAKRLVDILGIWDANRSNSDEEFWQIQFNQNSYVLSQVFSVPVIFIQDKAYVGGMSVERRDAKFVDYLYSGDASNEAILIEIKAPTTKLLGSKYRNIYKPSPELSGALVQISDYKLSLVENLSTITRDSGKKLTAFNPRCLILAGNSDLELKDSAKRRSFELFRTGLQKVEIVTYDELFKKIEVLATLFNLVKKKT